MALGADAVPALMAALRRDIAPTAARVLARIGPLAAPAVVAGAASPNPQVRMHCLTLLGDLAPEQAADLLWEAWADSD